MNFTNITNGHNCDCMIDCSENYRDKFLRRIDKKNKFRIQDFKSMHERGKSAGDQCDAKCGERGISVDIYTSESLNAAIETIKRTCMFNPMSSRKHLVVISFKEKSGMVKYTPEQVEYNAYHYDFFKVDDFEIDMVEVAEFIVIED